MISPSWSSILASIEDVESTLMPRWSPLSLDSFLFREKRKSMENRLFGFFSEGCTSCSITGGKGVHTLAPRGRLVEVFSYGAELVLCLC